MPHATATFKGKVIAETDVWENVEGNIYVCRNSRTQSRLHLMIKKFPTSSIDQSVLTKTNTHTPCPWKGEASYYTITVDGKKSISHPCKRLLIPLQDKRQRIRPGIIQSRRRRLSISRTMSPSVFTQIFLGAAFAPKSS